MLKELICVAIAVALFHPATALSAIGSEEKEARAAFSKGVGQFNDEQYKEALTSFSKAYKFSPNWKLLYNIGQCHAVLKQYGQAIDAFEQYLAEGGDDVSAERRDTLLVELGRLRKMVGIVMLEGADGVDVFVDGVKRGVTPLAGGILLGAGKVHEFRFEKNGVVLGKRDARVRGGTTLTVKIPRAESAPVAAPAEAQPAVVEKSEPEGEEDTATEPGASRVEAPQEAPVSSDREDSAEQPGRKTLHPAFFWTGVALTAAFGVGILAMDLSAMSAGEDITDQGQLDTVEGLQAGGIAFIALTGAAAVATGVLFFFTDFKGTDERAGRKLNIGAWSGGNGGGVSIQGRF